MLQSADNVHVAYDPLPFGQGWLVLHVGREHYRMRRVDKKEFRGMSLWAERVPQRVATIDRRACWMFQGRYFWDDGSMSQVQVRNLLDRRLATR